MGGEFGQWQEWNHDASVQWDLLQYAPHQGIQRLVEDLNRLYRELPALHERDFDPEGFAWIDANDAEQSVVTFLRRGRAEGNEIVAAFNFTPVPRHNYIIGVPHLGRWREILNSDATVYGGSGQGNLGGVTANPVPSHGYTQSITITIPPLGAVFFTPDGAQS